LGTTKTDVAQSGGGTLTITTPPPATTASRTFVIEGTILNGSGNYFIAHIIKDGGFTELVPIRGRQSDGAFRRKLYLRHGAGAYTVELGKAPSLTAALNGNGFLYAYSMYQGNGYPVNCTASGATENDWLLMPSGTVRITQELKDLSDEICAGKTTDADKVKAINKWVVLNMLYDTAVLDSTSPTGVNEGIHRKQDSLTAKVNGIAVCEGYAQLFAALARAANIKTRVVTGTVPGGAHAWNHVYVDGDWKLVDTTWNDHLVPGPSGDVNNSYTESNYAANLANTENYCLVARDKNGHPDVFNPTDRDRSVADDTAPVPPPGFVYPVMPSGYYGAEVTVQDL
jgi:transglutaminase-like putative cysteine protease